METITRLTMDLTGEHELYREPGRVHNIFKFDQKVRFNCTVFADTIKVFYVSGTVVTEMELNKDYYIPDWAHEDEDGGNARRKDSSFNRDLVSAIVMTKPIVLGESFSIEVQYQRLYPLSTRTPITPGGYFNVTGELIYELKTEVEYLKSAMTVVSDINSTVDTGAIALELDVDCTNTNNYVKDELHQVNVPNRRFVIQPKGGSFFKNDEIKVYHPGTDTVLVEGTDYHIFGMDEVKTKAALTTYPVYQFIILTANIVDEVEISYHAFGGQPTLDDYTSLQKNLNTLVLFLNDHEFMTTENLGRTESFMSIVERMNNMEASMRRLTNTPSYGDVSHGRTLLMKLFADTPGLHWYSIASLYTTDGNTTPMRADTLMFRFKSQSSHIQFLAAVSVDLTNEDGHCLNVDILSENYPRGFVPFKDYSKIASIIRPMFRLVWNDSELGTGAILQLGFNLLNMVEEIVVIEDVSGRESCWKLIDAITGATEPSDDNFMLPDGRSTWASVLSTSLQENMLVPYKKGHLVWAGDIIMNDGEGWHSIDITDHLFETDIDISRLSKLRVNLQEESGLTYALDINFTYGSEHMKGHASFTHQDKPAYINGEVYYAEGKILFRIGYDISAGTSSNKLHMRDLLAFS